MVSKLKKWFALFWDKKRIVCNYQYINELNIYLCYSYAIWSQIIFINIKKTKIFYKYLSREI